MTETCHRRSTCRLCGSSDLTLVLALTPTPPANAFIPADALDEPQPAYPLEVFFCEGCGHVQLLDVVDPHALFDHYVYVSGTSPLFVRHFEDYAADLLARYRVRPESLIIDIGSNDGTLLKAFKDADMRVQGIDPAVDIAREAVAAGIPTFPGFFTPAIATRMEEERGRAAIITANNVFAHINDLAAIVEGIRILLARDGVFVFEVSYLVDVYEKTLFDTVYHEHLDYHTVAPLQRFFASQGMELIRAERIDTHGGSLRATVQRAGGPHSVDTSVADAIAAEQALGLDQAETLKGFAARIESVRDELKAMLAELKSAGKIVAGFGAPAKATTLMHHFGIGPDVVDFIVDDSPWKQGLYTPGLHIPVVSADVLYERRPDAVVILAWNFADSIIDKHSAYRDGGGRFIVPLPQPRMV